MGPSRRLLRSQGLTPASQQQGGCFTGERKKGRAVDAHRHLGGSLEDSQVQRASPERLHAGTLMKCQSNRQGRQSRGCPQLGRGGGREVGVATGGTPAGMGLFRLAVVHIWVVKERLAGPRTAGGPAQPQRQRCRVSPPHTGTGPGGGEQARRPALPRPQPPSTPCSLLSYQSCSQKSEGSPSTALSGFRALCSFPRDYSGRPPWPCASGKTAGLQESWEQG